MEEKQSNYRPEKETKTENYTDSNPVVVQDGSCKHYYEKIGVDPEGKGEAKCRDCMMGRYFNLSTEAVKDGRIISK